MSRQNAIRPPFVPPSPSSSMSLSARRSPRAARLLRRIMLASMLLVVAACSDEAPVSGPGTLTATLSGPNGAEGAAVLALLGDGVGSVTPVGATEAYVREGDSQLRVVLVNPAGGALSFRVAVADTTEPPAFVIEEVAGPDDALRPDVGAYSLEFSR